MSELHEKINSLNCNAEQIKQFKVLFTVMAKKYGESECKGLLLDNLFKRNKKHTEIINILEEELQKERDAHNLILKKYNEKPKPEKVSIPGINLSISLKENLKH